jgi:hypothetical protein
MSVEPVPPPEDAVAEVRARARAAEAMIAGVVQRARAAEAQIEACEREACALLQGTLAQLGEEAGRLVAGLRRRAEELELDVRLIEEQLTGRPPLRAVPDGGADGAPDGAAPPAAVAVDAAEPAPEAAVAPEELEEVVAVLPVDAPAEAAPEPEPAAAPPAPEPSAAAPEAPPAAPDAPPAPRRARRPGGRRGDAGRARLVALNLALQGTPREDVAAHLRERLPAPDAEAILDEVFERAGEV